MCAAEEMYEQIVLIKHVLPKGPMRSSFIFTRKKSSRRESFYPRSKIVSLRPGGEVF